MKKLPQIFALGIALALAAAAPAQEASKPTKRDSIDAEKLRVDLLSYKLEGVRLTNFKPEDVRAFHAESVEHFINEPGFGYSRRIVMPPTLRTWASQEKLQEVYRPLKPELIGIAMHQKPVVYEVRSLNDLVSESDKAKSEKVKTRKLDEFETEALEKLNSGADMATLENPGELRVVGALRATSDCMSCHACKEHELLGAFSYRLLSPASYKEYWENRNQKRDAAKTKQPARYDSAGRL
jgi:hypothetical protein